MRYRRLLSLSALTMASLPLAVACSPGHSDEQQNTKPPLPASSVSSSPSFAKEDQTPVTSPPELDPDETLAGRQGATHGGRTITFTKGGKKGSALIVAVRCQGRGTMKVAVKPVTTSFPLACLDGEVTTTYNQLALAGVQKEGTVSVTASAKVRWSMTIGRGEPPEGAD
ncbi:hypothetical protein [Streptomyces sp. NPDC006552]|uniref:hypothetical protein n=1 Tax=Streptomyces sp. NPDC006552 TaxID=3157179 RepID=UPI0033B6125A